MNIIQCLRIFGPITIPDIANRTNCMAVVVEDNLKTLVEYGVVRNLGPLGFDVTDEGRRIFEQNLQRGVERRSAMRGLLGRLVG